MALVPLARRAARVLAAVESPRRPSSGRARDALGLVLADDVVTDESVPPFANTAMDGYARPGRRHRGRGAGTPRSGCGSSASSRPATPRPIAVGPGRGDPDHDRRADARRRRRDRDGRAHRRDGDDGVLVEQEARPGDHVRAAGGDLEAGAARVRGRDRGPAAPTSALLVEHRRDAVSACTRGRASACSRRATSWWRRARSRRARSATRTGRCCSRCVRDAGVGRGRPRHRARRRGAHRRDARGRVQPLRRGHHERWRVGRRLRLREGRARPVRRARVAPGRDQAGEAARVRRRARHAGVRPARQPGVVARQLRAVRAARAAPDDGARGTASVPRCWRRAEHDVPRASRTASSTSTASGCTWQGDGYVAASTGDQASNVLSATAAANGLALIPDGDGIAAGDPVTRHAPRRARRPLIRSRAGERPAARSATAACRVVAKSGRSKKYGQWPGTPVPTTALPAPTHCPLLRPAPRQAGAGMRRMGSDPALRIDFPGRCAPAQAPLPGKTPGRVLTMRGRAEPRRSGGAGERIRSLRGMRLELPLGASGQKRKRPAPRWLGPVSPGSPQASATSYGLRINASPKGARLSRLRTSFVLSRTRWRSVVS